MGELKWFLLAMVALFILWASTGGYERVENKDKPFLEQPSPIESGQPYTYEQFRSGARP